MFFRSSKVHKTPQNIHTDH